MGLLLRSVIALLLASSLTMVGVASVSADAGEHTGDPPAEQPAGEAPEHTDEPSDESPETDCIDHDGCESAPPHALGLHAADRVPTDEILDPPSPPPRR